MAPESKPDEPPEIQLFKHHLNLNFQLSNHHLHYGDSLMSLPLILLSSNLTTLPTLIQVPSNMLAGPEAAASYGLAQQGCCTCQDATISTILQATATMNQSHISAAQEYSAMLHERRNGRAKLTQMQDKAIAVMV
ncbi:uncharacterized protein FFB20_14233 [Fusarium fujikuroi]|uniref:Uncharacterized protein n=1 Tax=Fusarium fujikuroi TaxID=5127 RepID=A0A2H3RZR1_FUSFU|nr:uncharacterized protein FFC1_05638 [Fusarium fujikuroi]SCN93473.1 uncharacterized protein FFE2_07731 [Fusarium fujikuroi]SCO13315.1 uncharacterized protein FFB20_14233 [Fusarium fujikuroi]SCO41904.1 uncharacterized protein FFNC_08212 [Fusarium fujikuroi]SCV32837.1 uncharacterized protein FFFS_03490 [Fusarium fujikuroi]